MTNELEVFDIAPLLCCCLAFVGWVGMACLQRFVLPVSIRRLAYGPRLGLAFATWFFAIDALCQVLETATHRPHWLIALSAALASEVALFCYRLESPSTTAPQQVNPLLHSASNEVSTSGRDVRAPGSAGVPPAHSYARQSLTSDRRHYFSALLPVLRIALIAVVSVLLLEPVFTHEDEHEEEHVVAVVVDVSDSMNLPARLETDPDRSRSQAAHQLLVGDSIESNGLLERLSRDYDVRLYELGASAREVETTQFLARTDAGPLLESGSSHWTASTDFADALRQVRGDIPAAKHSGILMVSDGRDHSSADLQQLCQSLGQGSIPVNSIVIGSQEPPRDAQIVGVQAPSQIYHGDSVSLTASIKVDQYPGETAAVRLFDGDELIEEQSIAITSDHHRDTVTFRHQPEMPGVHEYRVELAELPNEESAQNNQLLKPVWVSQDRIRVLLIDERPRW